MRFDFLSVEVSRWHKALQPMLWDIERLPRRTPIQQLVKSMISGRTYDAVSRAAFDRLMDRYPEASGLADALPETVEPIIADVTFASDKARNLPAALSQIRERLGGFELDFLLGIPVPWALEWLEGLPGVGRKVAASTLNASTLSRPVLIVDAHVLRILSRLGAVPPKATARAASEAITQAMPDWSGDDFLHFHVMMKRLGQGICRAIEPDCTRCPLARDCL